MENKKIGFWNKIFIAVAIFAVIGVLIKFELFPFNLFDKNSGEYQAVFMTNGQVYFGKLSNQNESWLTLKDIYYLQTTPTESANANDKQTPSSINLVKLGSELHGPTNEMRINRPSVMFVEDLRSDSNIIMAINKLENNN